MWIHENSVREGLRDYKFFCFDGIVKYFKIDIDRYMEHKANYYDSECNLLDVQEIPLGRKPDAQVLPDNINEMIAIAEKLSKGLRFVRVDLYNVNGKIYFGEFTFFPASGFAPLKPEEWNYKFGEWLKLEKYGRT